MACNRHPRSQVLISTNVWLPFFQTPKQVDRKLLGGFILEFEDRRVDLSIAKKNEEFNALVSKLEADLN